MVADELDYVIGVDPHRDRHALAVVGVPNGQVVIETDAAATSGGYRSVLGSQPRTRLVGVRSRSKERAPTEEASLAS